MVWFGWLGSVGLVWKVWFGKFSLGHLVCDVWLGRFGFVGLVWYGELTQLQKMKTTSKKKYCLEK